MPSMDGPILELFHMVQHYLIQTVLECRMWEN